MAIIKCKMCGGDLEINEGLTVAECEYCGTTQTVPNVDNEKKVTLFARANRLRAGNEFDKASGIYESIVADFPEEAEAYWGLVLCKYGIEYVDDPATAKKIPTCHRSSFESVMDDNNFELTLEYADVVARKVYREEAKQIEEIRKGIIEVSSKEEPYDVFICYKETDENGNRTIDSVLAQDIYDALTNKGYRTFFARITLEDKLGQEYEPYIFAALNSAKIMLAVGTDYEYYNAVWVKNEWSRFLKLMATDKAKHLIPCYKNIDAYDMPKEFAKLQAQDLGKVGATQDLLRGIEKILPRQTAETVKETVIIQQSGNTANTNALLKRAFMFLEDKEFDRADELCEQVLNQNPECAEAYLYKLMAELKIAEQKELGRCKDFSRENSNYKKIMRFGNEELKATLEQALIRAENLASALKDMKIDNGVLREYSGTLPHVIIPDSVTIIDFCAFEDCSSLASVTIPDSVTSIGEAAFSGCENLKDIIVSDKNKAFIMKGRCLIDKNKNKVIFGFGDAVIPNDGSVTSINSCAFVGCKSLTSITIPNSVTSIGYEAFRECCSLTSITIPDSVTSIDGYAFVGCKSLTSITIPDSVTSIGEAAFSGCENLKDIIVSDKNKAFIMKGRCLIDKNEKEVIFGFGDAVIPNDGSVTSIGYEAFCGCTSLASVTIPNSVTSIGYEAFCGCTSLTSVIIPNSVTGIGNYAFSGCKSLTSITIPNSVTSIGREAFRECCSLTSITIPDSVTSIGYNAFGNCEKLTIFASSNSFAAQYAKKKGIATRDIELEAKIAKEKELEAKRAKELEAKRALEQTRRSQGLCQHCGGSFKGLFTKKCANCGKVKDY